MTHSPEIWFPYLGIKIEKLSRIAFNIFGIDVYWYGILIGFGVFLGLFTARREAKRTNQNPDLYTDFLLYAIIFSIIGARIYYVIFSWDMFKDDLMKIFALREGGIAIYGSIIGAALTALVFTKVKKINFFKFIDTCIFGLLVGQIIGRWGNFINREAFGGYTNSLLAMRYLVNQVGNISQSVIDKVVRFNGTEYIQVHPTFLYESLWNLGLLILFNIYKKNKKFDGEIAALYFIGYGIGRFWIEGLRTDQLIIGHTGIAVSQVLSIILIIVCTAFIIIKRKNLKIQEIPKN